MAISSLTLPLSRPSADSTITNFVSMCESLTENIAGRIQSLLFPSSKPTISSFANPSAPEPNSLLLSDEANKTIHTLECASRTLKRMIDTRLALAKAAAQTVVPVTTGAQLPVCQTPPLVVSAPTGAQLPVGEPRQLTSGKPTIQTVVPTSVGKSQQTSSGSPENPTTQIPPTAAHQSPQTPAPSIPLPKPATCNMQPAPLPATPATCTVPPATQDPQPAPPPQKRAPRPPLPAASLSRLPSPISGLLPPDSKLTFAEKYLQTRPIPRDPVIGSNGKSKKRNRYHGQPILPSLIETQLKNLGRNPLLSKIPIASS